jgi:hypothetical protein
MYTFFKSHSLRSFLFEQAPTLGISMIVAELFYKFHSFTLECLSFLATWYVLDGFRTCLSGLISNRFYKEEFDQITHYRSNH